MPMLGCPAMELNPLLRRAVELGASDIHLKVGLPPVLRRDGSLGPLEEAPVVSDRDAEAVLELVGKRAPDRLEAFDTTGDLDIAYQEEDLPRFRLNAFKQRGHISFAFRVIPKNVPNFEMLNLPPGVRRLAEEHRGLVLVTGATGSGKTTTLAAMIDHMSKTRQQHIVTIEDPIEILHSDHSCIVNQREIGLDTTDFMQALRRALRQDPDVILIRELKPESITDAIEEGAFFDMQSFTTALIDHVVAGRVDQEVAAKAATNKHDFLVALDRALKQQRADTAAEEKAKQEEEQRHVEPEVPTLRLAQAGD